MDTERWNSHVDDTAASYEPLVPVVKGNGYGFGRGVLAERAGLLAERCHRVAGVPVVAVGTVHELAGMPNRQRCVVLTPAAPDGGSAGSFPLRDRLAAMATAPVMTVGAPEHVAALEGWRGSVLVKLRSSMQRFGASIGELPALERAVSEAGLDHAGYSIHLPLAGTDDDRIVEVAQWLEQFAVTNRLPTALWVGHLTPEAHRRLREGWPAWSFPMRIGTRLWHGDKSSFHLGANVLDVHPARAGTTAGYHAATVPTDGSVVIVGAGSAHGAVSLDGGLSPFHYFRRRLDLLEPPHMHTSIAFVPCRERCPSIGDVVDVQRPLISVSVDEVIWQ